MKNLTWQNPEQLFVAQVLINQVKTKCWGIKVKKEVKGKKKKKNKKKKNDEVILPGFGSSLLEVIMRSSNCELIRINKECLTVSQQKEWENIGKIVFDWCCACKIKI